MSHSFNRREFLKLTSLLSAVSLSPHIQKAEQAATSSENILILVFDALSALNLPFYDYPRQTAPNLSRFIDSATVYHNHFASGTFTSPGTASLLTGVYPWKHRAFYYSSEVIEEMTQRNIFSLFEGHHRAAYSHNPLANIFFNQFLGGINHLQKRQSLYLTHNNFLEMFLNQDYDQASLSWTRIMKKQEDGVAYSIFLSELYDKIKQAGGTGHRIGGHQMRGIHRDVPGTGRRKHPGGPGGRLQWRSHLRSG